MDNPEGDSEIFTIDPDGTDLTQITHNATRDDYPEWSPDGEKIAFSSDRDGDSEIFVLELTSGEITQLTNNAVNPDTPASKAGDYGPTWSPDGTKIAFASNRDAHRWVETGYYCCVAGLYVVNASDGSDEKHLTTDERGAGSAEWSPDGSKILFSAGVEDIIDLYVINHDGSGKKNLTQSMDFDEWSAEWSPDGKEIVFTRESGTEFGSFPDDVWKMDADGSNQRQLMSTPEHERNPAFSPDGSRIAFVSGSEIFTIPVEGGTPKQLTYSSGGIFGIDWQPLCPCPEPPPPDTTAPTVTDVSPNNRKQRLSRDTVVTATFSEGMDQETLNAETVKLVKAGTRKPVEATVSCEGEPCETATLDPLGRLERGTRYKAIVTTGAEDAAGNALAERKVWSFTTGRG